MDLVALREGSRPVGSHGCVPVAPSTVHESREVVARRSRNQAVSEPGTPAGGWEHLQRRVAQHALCLLWICLPPKGASTADTNGIDGAAGVRDACLAAPSSWDKIRCKPVPETSDGLLHGGRRGTGVII